MASQGSGIGLRVGATHRLMSSFSIGFVFPIPLAATAMFIRYDQSTLDNMTAAIDSVCRKIPLRRDTPELRRQLADAMLEAAKAGRRNFVDFRSVGMEFVETAQAERASDSRVLHIARVIRAIFFR
jgi:hypothetical protein